MRPADELAALLDRFPDNARHNAVASLLASLARTCRACGHPAVVRSSRKVGDSRVLYLECRFCGATQKGVCEATTAPSPAGARE